MPVYINGRFSPIDVTKHGIGQEMCEETFPMFLHFTMYIFRMKFRISSKIFFDSLSWYIIKSIKCYLNHGFLLLIAFESYWLIVYTLRLGYQGVLWKAFLVPKSSACYDWKTGKNGCNIAWRYPFWTKIFIKCPFSFIKQCNAEISRFLMKKGWKSSNVVL